MTQLTSRPLFNVAAALGSGVFFAVGHIAFLSALATFLTDGFSMILGNPKTNIFQLPLFVALSVGSLIVGMEAEKHFTKHLEYKTGYVLKGLSYGVTFLGIAGTMAYTALNP